MLFVALAHTRSRQIQGRITCSGRQVCRERRAYALTKGDTWLLLINCKASSKFAGAQCLSSMRQASSFVVATSSSAIFGLFWSLQLSILSTSSFPTTFFIARAVGTLFTTLQSATQAAEILWCFPLDVIVANVIPREAGFPSQQHNILVKQMRTFMA